MFRDDQAIVGVVACAVMVDFGEWKWAVTRRTGSELGLAAECFVLSCYSKIDRDTNLQWV